jgi:hypothetical protein
MTPHRKQSAHLSYSETKVYIQKRMMSVKFKHLLLLFHKISIPIYAFLPALQNFKNVSAVEVRSSFTRVRGLPHQSHSGDLSSDLSRARTNGSLRGPNLGCRFDGRAVPNRFVFLCTRTQTGNPTGIKFRYPKVSIIPWTARCPIPSYAVISLTVTFRSCLMSSSTFRLLRSVAAVLCGSQRG